jgi:hypothetical protein
MLLDNSGNLGIGTVSPATKLEVYGVVRITESASGGILQMQAGSSALDFASTFYGGTYRPFTFTNGGSERMRIQSDGNVGIGTSSPAYLLDVRGDIRIGNGSSSEQDIRFVSLNGDWQVGTNNAGNGTNNNQFYFYDSAYRLTIQNGTGNVGIGTTSPASPLSVQSNAKQLRLQTTSGPTSYFTDIGSRYDSTHPFTIEVSNGAATATEYFGIYADAGGANNRIALLNGNVGINTTTTTNGQLVIYNSSGNTLSLQKAGGGPALIMGSDTTNYALIEAIASGGVRFYTGNGTLTEKMRIAADGNVGIGTSSPTAKLEIAGFSTGAGLKLNYGNSSGTIEAVNFIANGAANGVIGMQMVSAGVGDLWLGGSGGRTLTLYRDGNVGIGITSPTVKLTVSADVTDADVGQLRLVGSTSSAKMLSLGYQTTSNYGFISALIAGTGYSNLALQPNGGNVGIGTTTPFGTAANRTVLSVNGTTDVSLNIGSGGSQRAYLYGASSYAELGTIGSLPLTFAPNNSEKMRITVVGNVGIGTTSPSTLLHVNGSTTAGGNILFTSEYYSLSFPTSLTYAGGVTGDDGNYKRLCLYHGYAINFIIGNSATFANSKMLLDSTGNLGIGTTSPSVKLHVDGFFISKTLWSDVAAHSYWGNYSTAYGRLTWDTGLAWINATAGNVLYLGADGANKHVTIATSGNVGIGTASPSQKLEVSGTILASAFSGPLTGNVTGNVTGSSGSCTGNAASAGALNTSNDYTVASLTSNGFVYSGSSAGSTGAFYFNSSSHGIRRASGTNDVYCYTTTGTLYLGADGSSTTHIRVLSGGDVGIGVSPSYKLDVNGNIHATGFPTSSDIRFKKNITPLENSLEKIKKLQGVKYEWNEFVNSVRDGYKLNVPIIGLIAQDVEKIVPEVVDLWKLSDDCQDARSIDYPRLTPLLIEAIKEQQIIIENQNQKIENLIARMSALEAK